MRRSAGCILLVFLVLLSTPGSAGNHSPRAAFEATMNVVLIEQPISIKVGGGATAQTTSLQVDLLNQAFSVDARSSDVAKAIGGVYHLAITGEGGGEWTIHVADRESADIDPCGKRPLPPCPPAKLRTRVLLLA